jgi:hypothetical protein
MAVKTSWNAGDVLTAADLTDTFAAKAALAGATYTGTHDFTGATVTGISSGGLVLVTSQSFTTASAVNVNNCFTSTYDHYRVVIQPIGTVGATVAHRFRLRSSGTDLSGSVYFYGSTYVTDAGGPFRDYQGSQAQAIFGTVGDLRAAFSVDIFGPALARQTSFTSLYVGPGSTTGYYGSVVGWINNTSQYDGFSIYPASGTFTGDVRIYGYSQ